MDPEPSHYYRSHSAEPPRYQRTQSTESPRHQNLLPGEPHCAPNVGHLNYDQRLQGHPITTSCQPDYTQHSVHYRDIQQPARICRTPLQTHSRDRDVQQLFSETRITPQPVLKYIPPQQPMLVGNPSDHQARLYKVGPGSPSFGQTQQNVSGYTQGQPHTYGPIEDLHPAYGHTPHHGPSHWQSPAPAPLNGNIACSSPRPSKTHEPPDPQGHVDIPRLTPIGREGVETRQRGSADPSPHCQREGRSASRTDPPSECLLKSRKAVLPSEIRRRQRSVDDTMQRHGNISEGRRSRRISQSEEFEQRGVDVLQLDEGADKGRSRVGSIEMRDGYDERRVSPLGEEGNKGEIGSSHTQHRAVQDDGKFSESQERVGLGSKERIQGESIGSEKKAGNERWDNRQISKLSQVQHHVEGQFDGSICKSEKELGNVQHTEQPSRQAESWVRKSDASQGLEKRLPQFEIKHGMASFNKVDLNESRSLKVDNVENAEGQRMVQNEMSESQCRRRRISQPEEGDAHHRRRRISQSEDDWKGRRVRRISQSGNWEGQDQHGQTDGQTAVDVCKKINLDMPEAMDTTPAQKESNDPALHHRLDEVGGYLQSGSSLPQARHRRSREYELKPKVRTRSKSDIGVAQRSAAIRCLEHAASRETITATDVGQDGKDTGATNGEVGALDTRVSVAKLRHSYLENASGRRPELYVDSTLVFK